MASCLSERVSRVIRNPVNTKREECDECDGDQACLGRPFEGLHIGAEGRGEEEIDSGIGEVSDAPRAS